MSSVKLSFISCIVVVISIIHFSACTLEERRSLLDGLHLQIKTMKQRPAFPYREFSLAVTSLIELYNLQKNFIITSDLDQVLSRIMQATANNTCAWLKTKVDTLLGQTFNCTDEQLQGLKSWMDYESELIAIQRKLSIVIRKDDSSNHRFDYPTWLGTHFNCSNPDNTALRQYLRDEVLISGVVCS